MYEFWGWRGDNELVITCRIGDMKKQEIIKRIAMIKR